MPADVLGFSSNNIPKGFLDSSKQLFIHVSVGQTLAVSSGTWANPVCLEHIETWCGNEITCWHEGPEALCQATLGLIT